MPTALDSHCISLPSNGVSPSYFSRFPVRPPCRRFRLAPSQRNSPQAISHSFPSVHPVVSEVSLPPKGALPKLFPTLSRPPTLSSLTCCSFPTELSPSYFLLFPIRPLSSLKGRSLPKHSPQAISHDFHPVISEVSLARGKCD